MQCATGGVEKRVDHVGSALHTEIGLLRIMRLGGKMPGIC